MMNRREFIKTTTVATAGTMLAASPLNAATNHHSKIKNVGLSFGPLPKTGEGFYRLRGNAFANWL